MQIDHMTSNGFSRSTHCTVTPFSRSFKSFYELSKNSIRLVRSSNISRPSKKQSYRRWSGLLSPPSGSIWRRKAFSPINKSFLSVVRRFFRPRARVPRPPILLASTRTRPLREVMWPGNCSSKRAWPPHLTRP